jgi:hypothetical protein
MSSGENRLLFRPLPGFAKTPVGTINIKKAK